MFPSAMSDKEAKEQPFKCAAAYIDTLLLKGPVVTFGLVAQRLDVSMPCTTCQDFQRLPGRFILCAPTPSRAEHEVPKRKDREERRDLGRTLLRTGHAPCSLLGKAAPAKPDPDRKTEFPGNLQSAATPPSCGGSVMPSAAPEKTLGAYGDVSTISEGKKLLLGWAHS